MKFVLKINLSKEELNAIIDISKEIKDEDFGILIKVINKSSESDADITKPIEKFLSNNELTNLVNNGWKIVSQRFTLLPSDVINYFKSKKELGGFCNEIHNKFSYVSLSEVTSITTKLLYNNTLVPTRYVDCNEHGGYVLKEYFDENQKLYRSRTDSKKPWQNDPDTKQNEPQQKHNETNRSVEKSKPKKQLTKNEQKESRNTIISRATKHDIDASGFKKEFISSLDENSVSYYASLSDLQIKIMRSEVLKKE